jgi:hypothetical protein
MIRPLLLALLGCGMAFAAPITGLYNTGVDNFGVALPLDVGSVDTHWLNGSNNTVTYTVGAPPYIANTAISKWISVDTNGGTPDDVLVPFTLQFNMAPFATASITGRWAVDNCGTATLNGNLFSTIGGGTTCNSASANFTGWTAFSVNSGFNAGPNTLSFNVYDTGGAGAVRVEFIEANFAAVPEPSTFMLGASALMGLIALRRRRHASRSSYATQLS